MTYATVISVKLFHNRARSRRSSSTSTKLQDASGTTSPNVDAFWKGAPPFMEGMHLTIFQSTFRKASGSARALTTFVTTPGRWCVPNRLVYPWYFAQEANLRLQLANRERGGRPVQGGSPARRPTLPTSGRAKVLDNNAKRSPEKHDSVRIGGLT